VFYGVELAEWVQSVHAHVCATYARECAPLVPGSPSYLALATPLEYALAAPDISVTIYTVLHNWRNGPGATRHVSGLVKAMADRMRERAGYGVLDVEKKHHDIVVASFVIQEVMQRHTEGRNIESFCI
jgi:hypothetical protein